VALGTNKAILGHSTEGTIKVEGGCGAEMVDSEDKEATGETEDVTMTECETMAPTATETETGAPATNNWSDPAQLHYFLRLDHCCAGDGG